MSGSANPASTGVRSIDVGHECLMFLIERFYHPSVICHEGGGTSCGRIEQTIRFVRRQFEREEDLMRLSGFDDLHAHVSEHQELLARLDALYRQLEGSRYDNESVGATLRDWCRDHVERFDRAFGSHLESCGVSTTLDGRT